MCREEWKHNTAPLHHFHPTQGGFNLVLFLSRRLQIVSCLFALTGSVNPRSNSLSRLERLGVEGFRVGEALVGGQGLKGIRRCVRRVMSQLVSQPIPLDSSSLALFFLTSIFATLTQSSTGTP